MASLKIGITDEAKTFVEDTAARDQTSEAAVVRKALEAYRFLDGIRQTDGEILLKRKDGHIERLVSF